MEKVCIIVGRGSLPLILLDLLQTIFKKINVIILKNQQINENLYKNFTVFKISLGEVGKFINYLHSNNISNLLFAGNITKPDLSTELVDAEGQELFQSLLTLRNKGNNSMLHAVGQYLRTKGFNILSILTLFKEQLTLPKNEEAFTKIVPSEGELKDIKFAYSVIKEVGKYDIGQSIVINNGTILGLEGAEGTNELIKRCSILKNNNSGILVKTINPTQDLEFDLPTVGLETIKLLHTYKFRGLCVGAEKVLVLNKLEIIELANQLKIFIVVI